MPAPVPSDDRPASSRLTLLFRAGLAVAGLAVVLLLVADGNGLLRVAAVLAVTALVMIGLSISLRPDAATEVRQLADEIDELRAELATVADSARQAAETARRPVGAASARARVEEAPAAPGPEAPRAGRARVAVPDLTGADPNPVDEPERVEAAPDRRPRRAAAVDHHRAEAAVDHHPTDHHPTDHHRAEAAVDHHRADRHRADAAPDQRRVDSEADHHRAEVAVDRHRAEVGADQRGADAGPGRRRAEEPEEDERPWVEERPGGRRRADDPADDHRRSEERGAGRRRLPEPDGEESSSDHRRADGWYADEEPPARPRSTSRYATGRTAGGGYAGSTRSDGQDVRPGAASGPEVPPRPVGVVRHTETVHVTTRHTIVDGTAPDPGAAGGYGRWGAPEEQSWTGPAPQRSDHWEGYPSRQEQPRSGRPRGSARPVPPPGVHDDRSWEAPPTGPARPGPGGDRSWPVRPDDRPGAHGGDPGRPGARIGPDWSGRDGGPDRGPDRPGAYGDPDWSATHGGPAWSRHETGPDRRTSAAGRSRYGSGADERYGHRGGERPAGADSRWDEAEHPASGRAYPAADSDDWSEVRAGGRWATVRDDEHGRELRMGERRAAVHADGDGTELRVEDNWAAVRRSRRGYPDDGYDQDRSGRGGAEHPRGRRGDAERALPPGGVPVPEQWRPGQGDRPVDGRPASPGPEPAYGWPAPQAETAAGWSPPNRGRSTSPGPARGWSPPDGRRQADDWPESSRGGWSEPGPDRYGRPSWEHGGHPDEPPERRH